MTIRYDPGEDPRRIRRPRPRTPIEQAAVDQLLATTRCTNPRRYGEHMIPNTSTICLYCQADANTLNQMEIPL